MSRVGWSWSAEVSEKCLSAGARLKDGCLKDPVEVEQGGVLWDGRLYGHHQAAVPCSSCMCSALNFHLMVKSRTGEGSGMCHGTSWREVAFPMALKPCPSSRKKWVTLLVGRCLESACRYSGHYSAQGNLRGCKNCIPWESAIGYRFLKWKKGCRGTVWWAAMREKRARRRRNACVQKLGQKQG